MLTILDLYSGCGGFTLAAHQAGFTTSLAVDLDPLLTASFPLNFPVVPLLRRDIRLLTKSLLSAHLPKGVDGIVGGPPCQAFSEIGRRDFRDPRRRLVVHFFRLVALLRPKFFVLENVRGLGFPGNIDLLNEGLELLPSGWKIIGPVLLNAKDFEAPTSRTRLFVFGFHTEEMNCPSEAELLKKSSGVVSVQDAIEDLGSARHLGSDNQGFDVWKYDGRRRVSRYAHHMRTRGGCFTGHMLTLHTKATVQRFERLPPGARDKIGKYIRLSWNGVCPTLRAGTGNDRGSYQAVRPIHPEENRVITPREAARLQGFPDHFRFHPTVWHSCRMIGNSVSPVLAKKLLQRIAKQL